MSVEGQSVESAAVKPTGVVPFVKELARYFMDFLETDFHKVRNPKRHIQYRNSNNLQIYINLNKYKNITTALGESSETGSKGPPSIN